MSEALAADRPSAYQRLLEHLQYLELKTAAENLSAELDRGLKQKLSATQVLEHLLELEVEATRARRRRSRTRDARLPAGKALANFDFDVTLDGWLGLSSPPGMALDSMSTLRK